MNLFDQLERRLEEWLDELDHERDVAARLAARHDITLELAAWIDQLERERDKHLELLARVYEIRRANYPALVLGERPSRVLKAELPVRPRLRKGA